MSYGKLALLCPVFLNILIDTKRKYFKLKSSWKIIFSYLPFCQTKYIGQGKLGDCLIVSSVFNPDKKTVILTTRFLT